MTENAATPGSLFAPENFGSGGFLDDVRAKIIAAQVNTWDEAPDACFMILDFARHEDGPDDEPRREYYTIGKLDKFTPSKDHTRPVYEAGTKMNNSNKTAMFMKALLNAGYPPARIQDDVRHLVGLDVHLNAISMKEIKKDDPKFKGKKADGPRQVVVVTKIYAMPGEGATAAAPAATGGNKREKQTIKASDVVTMPAAVVAAAATGDVDTAIVEATEQAIVGLIANGNGKAAKRSLPQAMFQVIKDGAVRKAAVALCGQDAWLGNEARPWSFDAGKGELSLG